MAMFLKNCQIGGPIPSWISTLNMRLSGWTYQPSNLWEIFLLWLWNIYEVLLSDNQLQGSFTPTSGPLSYLDLSMHDLSGRLPADIHMLLSNVVVFILADIKFGGQIPTSMANLKYLLYLDMSNNCLRGNVPATLGNLTSLQGLHLQNNYLKGEIPRELGSLSNLRSLRIGNNSLHGVLPQSLRNLSGLQVLDVGRNYLRGNIPHWIATLSSLHVPVMRSNNFSGRLPPDICRMPNLSSTGSFIKFFSGTIPHSYFKFPAIQNSSADGGHLLIFATYGMYSDSIELIVKGQELLYERVLPGLVCFHLSNNKLSGPLLPDIENLKGLMYLNLSMNSLSRSILESLGKLVELESVDLSFNNFSGKIPWSLGNLHFLAVFNLCYNNLSGMIPGQGGQMPTFNELSYIGNPNLQGCPLQRNCSHQIAKVSPPSMGMEERKEDYEFIWYWMCFGLSVGVGFAVLKLSWRIKCFDVMDRVIEAMDKIICELPKF